MGRKNAKRLLNPEEESFISYGPNGPKRVPLDLALISEGELLADVNDEIHMVEECMVRFVERFGDKADKAKGRVTMIITFEFDAEDSLHMGVLGKVNSSVPKRPGRACLGSIDKTRRTVVCLPSGASADDPAQGRLCTKDGRTIDPDTGEVR